LDNALKLIPNRSKVLTSGSGFERTRVVVFGHPFSTHLICRYNPENLQLLEQYVDMQSRENTYDLEANLAILKLYQLDSTKYNADIVCQIMLKAITNFPHTDFVLCKCLLTDKNVLFHSFKYAEPAFKI